MMQQKWLQCTKADSLQQAGAVTAPCAGAARLHAPATDLRLQGGGALLVRPQVLLSPGQAGLDLQGHWNGVHVCVCAGVRAPLFLVGGASGEMGGRRGAAEEALVG